MDPRKINKELEIEVAKRERAEEELKKSETLLRKTFESIPDLLTVQDRDLRIVLSNWHIYKNVPLEDRDTHPHCYRAYRQRNSPCEDCNALEVFKSGKPKTVEMFNPVPGVGHLEIATYPILDDSADVTMVLELVRDINDRKRIEVEQKEVEARLRQSRKIEAIGTLAGGIAHDFNNMLTGIIGFAEIALMDIPEGNTANESIGQVLQASNRAKALVKRILDFSRQGDQDRKPVQVHPIVKEALKLLRATLPTTIEIRQDIETKSDTVLADPTQVHQVLMNLCTNAYHAMGDKGGILEVSVKPVEIRKKDQIGHPDLKAGSYLRLSVSDTGCGMEPSTIKLIFDPYFTTKEKGLGTGMGLSVVHGIVKSHGGSINVYSEPGKGTTFNVLFPRVGCKASHEVESLTTLPMG